MDDIIILIPAYKPEKDVMTEFINKLKKDFKNIIIVDDGSGEDFKEFFDTFEKMKIKVLHHEVNKGKGRAIKTGFDYILNNYENILGTITADCDGQHTIQDIKKCADKLKEYPECLIVGCRDFNDETVPARSKFGNKLTRSIFKIFIGLSITDTQTGLRGFGTNLMKIFLNTVGERYEYETNMLIDCKTYDIELKEVTIETVYIKNNEGSHFNPIKDSLRIYKMFLKYIVAAVSSFVLDIILYTIFVNIIPLNEKIMISTIIARILSASYNFLINAKLVFKKQSKTSILKYIVLVIVQMFMSGAIVTFIASKTGINSTVIKIIVDTIIFIVNFFVQREWVFKNK